MLEINNKETERNVSNEINQYFAESEMNYEACEVYRKSNHPNDWNLYMVIAKQKDKDIFATWTSWNDKRKALNCGHYGLKSIEDCRNIIEENTRYIEEG